MASLLLATLRSIWVKWVNIMAAAALSPCVSRLSEIISFTMQDMYLMVNDIINYCHFGKEEKKYDFILRIKNKISTYGIKIINVFLRAAIAWPPHGYIFDVGSHQIVYVNLMRAVFYNIRKYIFPFCIVHPHLIFTSGWNPPSGKSMTVISYLVNNSDADDLVNERDKISAAMNYIHLVGLIESYRSTRRARYWFMNILPVY